MSGRRKPPIRVAQGGFATIRGRPRRGVPDVGRGSVGCRPRRTGDAPRDVHEQPAAGSSAGRRAPSPDPMPAPRRRRRPGRRRPGRGTRGPARSTGSPRARPARWRRRPGRPCRRGPSRPARRATRAYSGSAGAPATRRRQRHRGPAARRRPGWTSGTARRRTGRGARCNGATASAPRYGLTVTASAPRPSNSATAWRAAVVPMSPRLASATTRHVGRHRGADPLQGRQPGRPVRLEEREVRLDGRGVRPRPPPRGAARTLRRRRGPRRTRPAGRRVRVEAQAQDASRRPRPARRGARGSRSSRGAGRTAIGGRRRRSAAGSPAGGRPGRTSPAATQPSSPETVGQRLVSPTVQLGARAVELGHLQVDDLAVDVEERDARRRPATRSAPTMRHPWSGAGARVPRDRIEDDHVGPERVVRVAAMYRPSGDHDGSR